jgi:type I restriction enzyme S subunit
MPGEWPRISLREADVELIDCDHRTPPATEVGYPYVAIPELRNGRVELSQARRIKPEHYVEWTRRAKPRPYDVVLSRRCNPGETAFVEPGTEFALGQNLVLLRADGIKVYPPFLRWLVRGPEWWEQVGKFINVGAAFDSLKCADIPNFRLRLPTLPEQRAVANILGTLDDKIDLNRRTNETLEGIARALFKSWFVDFDPVRAKAEARRPAAMDAETAALFPASTMSGEIEIPTGWNWGRIGDVASSSASAVDPRTLDADTPYIGLEHMPRRRVVLDEWGQAGQVTSGKARFRTTDVLFGKLRPYFHKVGIPPVAGVCSTDVLAVAPKSEIWLPFVLMHLSSDDLIEHANACSTGTKMPRVRWSDIAGFEVAVPPERIAAAYGKLVNPLLRAAMSRVLESRTLAEVRDALLPKLLSGELCIRDAEKLVEAHV